MDAKHTPKVSVSRLTDPEYRAKQRKWNQEWHKRNASNPEVLARKAGHQRSYVADPELRPRHQARWKTRHAIESGKLVRKPCEVCGAIKVDAHHDDYSQPLSVRWLCRKHHLEHHSKALGDK